MFEIFEYGFMVRAFIAGTAIALIAPMIGTFLVLKRFSLFADSLAHVALAGVAIGILAGIYPVFTAVITCVLAAVLMEKLRSSSKVYSDSALSLFLSGSLAIALVLISLAKGFNVNLFGYLFGSITAVQNEDVMIIVSLSAMVVLLMICFYKEFFYIAFDEESAKVSGIPVKGINLLLMSMAAVTVSLSMRVVGILMVGALMVIPVLTALQIARSFKNTFFYGILCSLLSVFAGLILSYYLDIIAGGAIVICALLLFIVALVYGHFQKSI
jgi:zinc transport system permease protein